MNCCIKRVDEHIQHISGKKIPRPPNAFMLYANENRKTMAQMYPTESNKDISKRLGSSWKSLDLHEKSKYFDKAKLIDSEHKKKYPNYVYNPKEARIRKAMREATRDRSIGASPMLPRPSARLPSHEWNQSHEKHLMMAPLGGMRGSSLESAVCNFPISGSGSGQFMPSMSAYYKLDSPMPPNASVHTNYMQTNPLIQLQQQTEMWHSMQENVPQRSPGDNYMLPGVSSFHGHVSSPELPTNLMVEKPRTPVRPMSASNTPGTPPHANGNVSPVDVLPSESKVNEIQFESKSPEQNQVGAAVENTASSASTEPYLTSYQSPPEASQFNKEECSHAKKICWKSPEADLKDQCPKEKDAQPCACSQFCGGDNQCQVEYICKYFQNLPQYQILSVRAEDGVCFPYASLVSNKSDCIFLNFSEPNREPKLIPTDIGYIPILENDFCPDNFINLCQLNEQRFVGGCTQNENV